MNPNPLAASLRELSRNGRVRLELEDDGPYLRVELSLLLPDGRTYALPMVVSKVETEHSNFDALGCALERQAARLCREFGNRIPPCSPKGKGV